MAFRSLVASCVLLASALAFCGCHRNIEDYDPHEKVEQPDLSRIFPEGAQRTAERPGAASGMTPPGAPPSAGMRAPGAAAGAPAAAPSGVALKGTVRLAPALEDRVPAGAVLFLVARMGETGPPTAVKRIPSPRFPLEFEIGPGDRMVEAMPFDGPFRVSARVDADGNAMTRNPGDLQGASPGAHRPGEGRIEIVIDEIL